MTPDNNSNEAIALRITNTTCGNDGCAIGILDSIKEALDQKDSIIADLQSKLNKSDSGNNSNESIAEGCMAGFSMGIMGCNLPELGKYLAAIKSALDAKDSIIFELREKLSQSEKESEALKNILAPGGEVYEVIPSAEIMKIRQERNELREKVKDLKQSLKFCRDIAWEEYDYQQTNVGAECSLRLIMKKCDESLKEPLKP